MMGNERQAGGPVSESTYELPNYVDAIEAVLKSQKQSVQDTLNALADQGYYLVKRKKK